MTDRKRLKALDRAKAHRKERNVRRNNVPRALRPAPQLLPFARANHAYRLYDI